MSALADVVLDVIAALEGAGIAATADPDLIGQYVASQQSAALVMPPEVESRTLSSPGRLDVRVDVYLLGAPPGGLAQFTPIWDDLDTAMGVLPAPTADRTTFTTGGVTYPGYLLTIKAGTA